MKKVLALMLTLLVSVTMWAADPYYEVVSGSYESGNVTVKITFPDATTVEIPNDGFAALLNSGNDNFQSYTWKQYGGDITSQGNTLNVVFVDFTPQADENAYYIYAPKILVDGVAFGYTQIYDKKNLPAAVVLDGSLTSGSMTVELTFPKATTVIAGLGSSWTISLWNNGSKLDAKTSNSDVTSNGNSISTTFNFDAQLSDDLSACILNIDRMAIKIDGSWNSSALSFPVTSKNNGGNEPGNGPSGGEDNGDGEPDLTDYFWVKNTSMSEVTIVVNGEYGDIEYTYTPENTSSWVAVGNDVSVININFGTHEKVYFRAGENGNTTMNEVFFFESRNNAPYSVGGDITTLLDRAGNVETLTENETFAHMFADDKYLSDASELVLPSTTLSPSCYSGMFAAWGSWLQAGPEALPATNLAEGCYSSMFANCSMLTTAPELPATTLAPNCYDNMFYDCSSLQKAPVLPATKLVWGCYSHMFYNCSGLEPVIFAYIDDYDMSWPTNNFTFGNPMMDWVDNTPSGMTIYTNLKNWSEVYRKGILGSADVPLIDREMTATEDPDNKTNYYTTFYDSEFAYFIPDGITAYTATISGSNLIMSAIKGGIIPAGEGVLLKFNDDEYSHDWYSGLGLGDFYMSRTPQTTEKNAENVLQGTDIDTAAPADCFVFSYGQNGLGFYKYAGNLTANKAYLTNPFGSSAKALRMIFEDDDVMGIEDVISIDGSAGFGQAEPIYDLNGIRKQNIRKGINIVNDKKIIVK